MNRNKPLQLDKLYHIYNRGINSCKVFRSEEDYLYFIKLYNKYISGFATTYAWTFMPTHFHFIIKIESKNIDTIPVESAVNLHQKFSNMFNAYAKAYNLWNKRHGSLFDRAFKKINLDTDDYFRALVLYIHNNPVKDHLVKNLDDYKWTSYQSYLGQNNILEIDSDFVIDIFEDFNSFVLKHKD